jgi:hypothetical protein
MIQAARVAPLLRVFGAAAPVTSPVLSVVDHADNTGATATIAGAALGSTNTVYVQDFSSDWQSGQWASAGSASGSDSLTLGLAVGHYFAYVRSSLAGNTAVSAVVYFAVTDGLESIHTRCLAATQARIRLLALEGLSNARVVIEKLPVVRAAGAAAFGLPAILLSPERTAMPPTSGTNGLDDVHYDVLATILDRDNQEPTLQANLDRHLLWRQQIARAFRNQRLSGVPEVIDASVEPADGLVSEAWKRELMASGLLLRFTSREKRGL